MELLTPMVLIRICKSWTVAIRLLLYLSYKIHTRILGQLLGQAVDNPDSFVNSVVCANFSFFS